jgi:hypothetical protein
MLMACPAAPTACSPPWQCRAAFASATGAEHLARVGSPLLVPRSIERYVASGEPFGKAGAYAIQSALAAWIARIDGSYSGIMGLPLCCETASGSSPVRH